MTNENYEKLLPLWEYAADCYEGAERVKFGPNAAKYLPMSSIEYEELAQNRVPQDRSRYAFRRRIASYENFYRAIVDDLAGMMRRNPAHVRFGAVSDEESPK